MQTAYRRYPIDACADPMALWHEVAACAASISRASDWHLRPWIIVPQATQLSGLQQALQALQRAKTQAPFFLPELMSRAAFLARVTEDDPAGLESDVPLDSAILRTWPVYLALRTLMTSTAQTPIGLINTTDNVETQRLLQPGLETAASLSELAEELIETALGQYPWEASYPNKLPLHTLDHPDVSTLLEALKMPATAQARSNLALSSEQWLSWEAQCVWTIARLLGDEPRGVWARWCKLRVWSRTKTSLLWIDDETCPAWCLQFLKLHAQGGVVAHWEVEAAAVARHGWAAIWEELAPPLDSAASLNAVPGALPGHAIQAPQARIEAIACGAMEQAALCAATLVQATLENATPSQSPRVALVSFDRILARRTLALLRRVDIEVKDTGGWVLSTTLAASAIMHLLEAVQTDQINRFVDWLHSPFVLRELPDKAAWLALLLEETQSLGRVTGIAALIKRCNAIAGTAPLPWQALSDALLPLLYRKPLPALLNTLTQIWQNSGVREALLKDAAGQAVWRAWERVSAVLDENAAVTDWVLAFRFEAEHARFVPPLVTQTTVELLSLAATRARGFDQVIFLGGSERELPGPPRQGVLNDTWRRELGLTTRHERELQMMQDLAACLTHNPQIHIVWQAREGDEPLALSRWWQRLVGARASAWHDLTAEQCLQRCRVPLAPLPVSLGAGRLTELPDTLSVSAVSRLVGCPFQYYVETGLRLRERFEIVDEAGKREAGNALHAALAVFHQAQSNDGAANPQQSLLRQFDAAMQPSVEQNPAYRIYNIEARSWMKHYWAWHKKEAGTYVPKALEKTIERAVPGLTLRLRGRIDRLDEGATGQRLIDYKLSANAQVRAWAAAPEESVQMALYAWMLDSPNITAGYLSIERGGVKFQSVAEPVAMGERIVLRLSQDLQRALNGEPLRALGSPARCQRCGFRGLCRKGHADELLPEKD